MPDEAAVHAGAEGVVAEVLAGPNSRVAEGSPLVRMQDPLLDARVKVIEARVKELRFRLEAKDVADPVEAKIVGAQLEHALADLSLARKRQHDLLVRSTASGRFIVSGVADLPGQFLRKGEVLGYVAPEEEPLVRVIVAEDEADLVRQRTERIEVRFADRIEEVVPGVVEREVPALSDTLPSLALSTLGGGEIMVDPSDQNRLKALANLLHLELRPELTRSLDNVGGRVYVRFVHDAEALAWRLYRKIRQVFLKQFNV